MLKTTQPQKAEQSKRPKAVPHGTANGPAWLFPSIADLLFILLFFAMTFGALAPRLLADGDIGWHIRNGEWMLQTHSVTRTDPFSSSMSGRAWYAWEWLYDLAAAEVHGRAGLNAVVLLAALMIALTFALAFRLTLQRGGSLSVTVLMTVLAFGASVIHLFARPHVVSWLFALLWFALLDSSQADRNLSLRNNSRKLYIWLPLIMLLWVNLHGAFVLGFVLLIIYLFSAVIEYFSHPESRAQNGIWVKTLCVVTLLCGLASFANPYGYHLHAHVYRYLTNRWLMDHVEEFLSPNFHGIAEQCFVTLVLMAILAAAMARRQLRITHLVVMIFAIYSGFYASRNLPVASLLLTLIVAPIISRSIASASVESSLPDRMRSIFLRYEGFASRMSALESRLHGHFWPAATVILTVVICLNHGRLGQRQLMNAHFDGKRFPARAADFIAQRNIPGPVFSTDAWGGYLIYRLYPETRFYVDDRHDFYGDAFFKNYLNIVRVTPEWQSSLDSTGVDWVLVPEASSLSNILKLNQAWNVVYEDPVAALFQRRSPTR